MPSEPSPIGQEDLEVAERASVVKAACLDLEPSRGCSVRHLALQQYELPPVMLTPEYEEELME